MHFALLAPVHAGTKAGKARETPDGAACLLIGAGSAALWWLILWGVSTVM